jgi:hypothetical protein
MHTNDSLDLTPQWNDLRLNTVILSLFDTSSNVYTLQPSGTLELSYWTVTSITCTDILQSFTGVSLRPVIFRLPSVFGQTLLNMP